MSRCWIRSALNMFRQDTFPSILTSLLWRSALFRSIGNQAYLTKGLFSPLPRRSRLSSPRQPSYYQASSLRYLEAVQMLIFTRNMERPKSSMYGQAIASHTYDSPQSTGKAFQGLDLRIDPVFEARAYQIARASDPDAFLVMVRMQGFQIRYEHDHFGSGNFSIGFVLVSCQTFMDASLRYHNSKVYSRLPLSAARDI